MAELTKLTKQQALQEATRMRDISVIFQHAVDVLTVVQREEAELEPKLAQRKAEADALEKRIADGTAEFAKIAEHLTAARTKAGLEMQQLEADVKAARELLQETKGQLAKLEGERERLKRALGAL